VKRKLLEGETALPLTDTANTEGGQFTHQMEEGGLLVARPNGVLKKKDANINKGEGEKTNGRTNREKKLEREGGRPKQGAVYKGRKLGWGEGEDQKRVPEGT